MKRACTRFAIFVAIAGLAAGCTSRQIYQSAAGWRQNECQKILESADRAQCMDSANKDYDTYSKERGVNPSGK
ncbi:MAG TPA: hypothetical protein VHB46_02910 [Burkholderiales bacterium]|nr:hypothetical protein [Burkholderiales bacterium]